MSEEKVGPTDPKRDGPIETAGEADDRNIVDADLDSVVRGVGGAETPKAKRIRPLAGLIVIGLVVLAAGYMQHGLKNRKMKKSVQADAPRAATGPATVSEKSWMNDQARLGLNTGTPMCRRRWVLALQLQARQQTVPQLWAPGAGTFNSPAPIYADARVHCRQWLPFVCRGAAFGTVQTRAGGHRIQHYDQRSLEFVWA